MGCGFDVMGMTLDGVGDVVSVEVCDGDGLQIENRSSVELPDDIEKNVVTPAVRALMQAYGEAKMVRVVIEKKISPGSGIGSSAASSAMRRSLRIWNRSSCPPQQRKRLLNPSAHGS
jgi:homoserine kinase